MHGVKRFDNYLLPAEDLDRGRVFYRDVLGLPVKFDFSAQGFLAFRVGEEEPAIILRRQPGAKPAVWLEVDSVRLAVDALRSKGLTFLTDPFQIRTGLAVEFEDPFGNRLALADYSKSP